MHYYFRVFLANLLLFQAVAPFNAATFVLVSKSLQHRNLLPLFTTFASLQQSIKQRHQKYYSICRASISDEDESIQLPPHTALAQVLANQYNIDISSVEAKGKKITAADVEFHAYKVSQPPCTPQALELAYSYGLDLNVLYDDYTDNEQIVGQPHFLKISDVELLKENLRSLRVSTQTIKGKVGTPINGKRKQQHLDELERRMEKNVEQLSEKAMQAAGSVASVIQSIQSQVKLPIAGDIFASGDKVDSVQDFDEELAMEIQAALMSAGVDDKETTDLMSILEMPLSGSENGSSRNGIATTDKEMTKSSTTATAFYFADLK